jgi:hypothetical protein
LLGPALHLDRDAHGALVATRFVQAVCTVKGTAAKRNSNNVQNDVEWVEGLNGAALDRMHRFTRLMRGTGWPATDLDLVLSALGAPDIDGAALEAVADLHGIQRHLALAVAHRRALAKPVPRQPVGTSRLKPPARRSRRSRSARSRGRSNSNCSRRRIWGRREAGPG